MGGMVTVCSKPCGRQVETDFFLLTCTTTQWSNNKHNEHVAEIEDGLKYKGINRFPISN